MAKYFKNSGRKWEKDLQKSGAGQRQPLSGAHWSAKNDLKSKEFLREAKATMAEKTYTLKKADLRGVAYNAMRIGRVPLLDLYFSGDEYVIMRKSDFDEFIMAKETNPINEPEADSKLIESEISCSSERE